MPLRNAGMQSIKLRRFSMTQDKQIENQRKSYIITVKPELGKELEIQAAKQGMPYQVFARMMLKKGLVELVRKHKRED
jgi:predicted DNA binding CopG/RHH family protein